ncbi:NAD(P)-dependent oxidoreductase [Agrococcus sp. SGAir0287]|nr:NAD(P)-dependent oxidoreductase [Agrococcus sp. SGAir0287]
MTASSRGLALVGLGAMGRPMARRLASAGALTVWNRSAARAQALAAEHPTVRVAASPALAASDVTITVLPDLDEVRAVLEGPDGLLAGWRDARRTPMLVVCGTVSPVALRRLAAELEGRVEVVDAPLSGGVVGAAEGRLSIMVGGTAAQAATLAEVLAPCASRVTRMGPTGAGATAKLCNQLVVAETVAALSEAFALARAAGLDADALADALGAGLASSEVLRQKRHHWVDETFEPGGTIDYQVKDLRYARDAAADAGLRLPLGERALALFEEAVDAGDGALDHTGVYRTIAG